MDAKKHSSDNNNIKDNDEFPVTADSISSDPMNTRLNMQQYQQQDQHPQLPFRHGPIALAAIPLQLSYPYNPPNIFAPLDGQCFYPHTLPPMIQPPSETLPKKSTLSEETPEIISELTESQMEAIRNAKKSVQEMIQKHKAPKRVLDGQQRKKEMSRTRAAKLREKVSEIKGKAEEEKSDAERNLLQIFEERRSKKNDRSRQRDAEKKNEAARILAIPESERTPEDANTLDLFIKTKQRKIEKDRMYRERMKKSRVGKRPRGRPRKNFPNDQKKQSSSSTITPLENSADTTLPAASQPDQSLQESMQRTLVAPSESIQSQQQLISFASTSQIHMLQTSPMVDREAHTSIVSAQPNPSTYDISNRFLYGSSNCEQVDDVEKIVSL